MKFTNLYIASAALGVALIGGPAQAVLIINFNQIGPDVVASMSGSIDTTDLITTQDAGVVGTGDMVPGDNFLSIQTGGIHPINHIWHGITGPLSFGTGTTDIVASSSTGGPFTLDKAAVPLIYLPSTYVSGDPISGSLTFDSTTLAALGLTPGASFNYTWGSDTDADSLQINIEPSVQSAPEPASLAVLAAGLTALGLIRRRRPNSGTV